MKMGTGSAFQMQESWQQLRLNVTPVMFVLKMGPIR